MCVVHICRYASPTINLVYPFIQKLFTETQEYIAFKIFIIYIASGIDGEDFLEFELHEISQSNVTNLFFKLQNLTNKLS